MLYITGIYALNLPCSLNTDGDWHCAALNWKAMKLFDSKRSFFGNYGIEKNKNLYEWVSIEEFKGKKYNIANHIRALLDLIYQEKYSIAQGMRDDFIDNSDYTLEIFNKINEMKNLPYWHRIDKFMGKEYKLQWINYRRNNDGRLANKAW